MPLPEKILGVDPCAIASKWLIDVRLATLLELAVRAAAIRYPEHQRLVVAGCKIISGYRTPDQQEALQEAGRPTAPVDRSTHTSCPATGADLRIETFEPSDWRLFGQLAESVGLRWGGGSERIDGIPIDFNHFDMGPRR